MEREVRAKQSRETKNSSLIFTCCATPAPYVTLARRAALRRSKSDEKFRERRSCDADDCGGKTRGTNFFIFFLFLYYCLSHSPPRCDITAGRLYSLNFDKISQNIEMFRESVKLVNFDAILWVTRPVVFYFSLLH